jgi:hypothetical protein
MVNINAITEWSEFFAWKTNAMIEQDLIISRLLVAIFSDKYLSELSRAF